MKTASPLKQCGIFSQNSKEKWVFLFCLHSHFNIYKKNFFQKWSECVDFPLVILLWSFLKQGLMKQLLTDGERYVMTFFNTLKFDQQGIYDVVNNLGSLAARFLFKPIETAAYFYFSQLVQREVPIKAQIKQVCIMIFWFMICQFYRENVLGF